MANSYSPRSQRLLVVLGPEEAYNLGSRQLEVEHILLALLKSADGLGYLALKAMRINVLTFQLSIEQSMPARLPNMELYDLPYSDRLKTILEVASIEARMLRCDYIGTEHILLAAIREEQSLTQSYFVKAGISLEQARQYTAEIEKKIPSSAQLEPENSVYSDGTPQNFVPQMADGYSNHRVRNGILSQFSRDLTQEAKSEHTDPVVGRSSEIQRIIQVLSRRTKNNPVLVGDPGVGKTAIVEGLAQRIAKGSVPHDLLKKRILALDLGAIVAGTKYRGEFEERMKRIMKEVKESKDIILFIDELHTIIGAGGPEGALDASNMLKPALSRGEIQIIGATTTKEFRKYMEKDSALVRRFQKIKVEQPSEADTSLILDGLKSRYEDYHHVLYEDGVVDTIVRYSVRYIPERFLPDKAIDILDEAGAAKKIQEAERPKEMEELEESIEKLSDEKRELVSNQDYERAAIVRDKVLQLRKKLEEFNAIWKNSSSDERKHVTVDDVCRVISAITGIPVDKLDDGELTKLLNMEKSLHEEVIGQDSAIDMISSAVRRSRAGVSSGRRPVGSFIFLGPTGVGKTQLAKALAKFLFGTEDSLIRIDMSDFMEKQNASRLVGAPPGYIGYDEGGMLTEKVRQHPYSVVLLDEIEKAHPDIFNLLLQMLEEGELSDNLGHVVNFRNTVIIMTSNAGARKITTDSRVGFSVAEGGILSYNDIKASATEELKKMMPPELLNRIDEIIVFDALNKEQMSAILDVQLKDLEARLKEKALSLVLTPAARSYMVEHGFEPTMGARPLRRLIQQEIEDPIATLLLSGKRGLSSQIIVDAAEDALSVYFKEVVSLVKEAKNANCLEDIKEI